MALISELLDDVCNVIQSSVLTANQSDNRLIAKYQITLANQYRDYLLALKPLAEGQHTAAMWVIIRTLSELFVRSSWIGLDNDRAIWFVVGEKVFDRNQIRNRKKGLEGLGLGLNHKLAGIDVDHSPSKDDALIALEAQIAELAKKVPHAGCYWNVNTGTFRQAPKFSEMAPLVADATASLEIRKQEETRIWVANNYYKMGSMYTHSTGNVLQDYFDKEDINSPTINFTADNQKEFKASLSATMTLSFIFVQHLESLGYKADKELLGQIIKRASRVHE